MTAMSHDPYVERRLTAEIGGWVERALERYREREDARWDVWLAIMPTPEGAAPMLGFLVTLPGVVVGERAYTISMSPTLTMDEAAVTKMVKDMLDGLRAERSKALAEAGSQPGLRLA